MCGLLPENASNRTKRITSPGGRVNSPAKGSSSRVCAVEMRITQSSAFWRGGDPLCPAIEMTAKTWLNLWIISCASSVTVSSSVRRGCSASTARM